VPQEEKDILHPSYGLVPVCYHSKWIKGGFVGLLAAFIYCFLRTKKKVITAFIIGVLAMFAAVVAPPSYWDEVRSITEEGPKKAQEKKEYIRGE
jgi:hypothetical protein